MIHRVNDDMMTYRLGQFEARLEENEKKGSENGFCVGNEMTIADKKLEYATRFVFDLDHIDAEKLLASFPRLTAWRKKMTENMKEKPKYYLFSMAKPMM